MKAWICRDKYECAYSTVVFAETRGKARAFARYTDACEYVDFVDIEVHRVPQMDKYYRGKNEMDWFDTGDRIALVKECGFYCSYEISKSDLRCVDCPAKEWCERCEGETDGN